MVIAPVGTVTFVPTAVMTPPLSTTVALSIGADDTGKTRAPVMAYEYGASCCADRVLNNTKNTKGTKTTFLKTQRIFVFFVSFVFKNGACITWLLGAS